MSGAFYSILAVSGVIMRTPAATVIGTVHFNAYTGYDRTVYSFSILADCDSALYHALRVVRYWFTDMQFSKARHGAGEGGL